MVGNRGIYKDGWLANTKPRRLPWEMTTPPGDGHIRKVAVDLKSFGGLGPALAAAKADAERQTQ